MRGVLLSRVVQLTALAQGLVVDGQRRRLHVQDLVVRYGALGKRVVCLLGLHRVEHFWFTFREVIREVTV